ncbi:hypothetical protein C8R45DRAFT_1111843 [Mycena sanguinolenta]|nr:hypothetical protein C8R45DRAFT_1111843 [Mycena sanguinolenta]
MSPRSASRKISAAIATIAAEEAQDSDDEMALDSSADVDVDRTLVNSGEDSDKEEDEDDSSDDSDSESEEDEAEESEDQDEEKVVPRKRKAKGKSRATEKKPKARAARDIEYKICTYTAQQMKKSKTSRGSPITEIITLSSKELWPRLKTEILTAASNALNPPRLNFYDYCITFTVPRQVTDPIHLRNPDNYTYLVQKALSIVKNPNAKIIVEPNENFPASDKENIADAADEDSGKGKKTGQKSKPRNARDILPANVALNEKIGELRERWKCSTPGGPCGSEHCFFSATEPEHFPLSHAHMENWAAAWDGQLKGTQFADLELPPNNELFDRASAKNAPAAPQVHFNFPPEFANILRPAAPPVPAPVVAHLPTAPDALVLPQNSANMLIPYLRIPGPDMSFEDFCTQYELGEDICSRFTEHRYKRTSALQFVEMGDLKEMGFMRGEIAELKVAIGAWSQLPGAH